MKAARRCLVMTVLMLSVVLSANGQGFEHSPFAEIGGGGIFPTGPGSRAYEFGPGVFGSIGVPVQGTVLLGAEISYVVPKIDVADATSDLLGFAATATVPFSPEASTTGYVTGGMGGYQMSISGKDASLSTPWKLGIHAGLGVCFAPEHWRSVYLDIQVRYTRVYFAGEYWQHLAITGGVGFHFQ